MSNSKHRQPRLRASCDGCFLAKVKCSKMRPICSRCLACGIECRYSPSSRAGKPKSDASHHTHHASHHSSTTSLHNHGHGHHPLLHHASAEDMAAAAAMTDDKSLLYTAASVSGLGGPAGLYKLDTAWSTAAASLANSSSTALDGPNSAVSCSHSVSPELALMAMDEQVAAAAAAAAAACAGDMYAAGAVMPPWTPPTDLSAAQFSADAQLGGIPGGMHAANSFTFPTAGMSWVDPASMEMLAYGHGHGHNHAPPPHHQQMPTPGSIASSANNYFPSPSTTPSVRQSPATGHKAAPSSSSAASAAMTAGAPCACFDACLQALQALHNASSPVAASAPPFDVVLALNRAAVEGCAAMLACARCMRRSGTHTAAMLLATLLGKITSFYKNASQTYFFQGAATLGNNDMAPTVQDVTERPPAGTNTTPSPSALAAGLGLGLGLGVSLGAYQLQGEDGRWLELEILNRELKRLEEVYTRFREVCGDLSDDVEVSKAMIGYLGQTLGSTLDMVSHSKGHYQFV